jgi:hypothetical protein
MAGDLEDAPELRDRISMLVHAQTEIWVAFGFIDQKRCRLAAAFVSAGPLTSFEYGDKTLGQAQRFGSGEGFSHGCDGRLADQHVSLNCIAGSGQMTEPGGARRTTPRRASSLIVDNADLAYVAAGIVLEQAAKSLLGGRSVAKKFQPVDPQIRIDP